VRVLHRRLAQPDSLPIKPTRPVQAAPDPHKPKESPKTEGQFSVVVDTLGAA
jgi:hypothetical protein